MFESCHSVTEVAYVYRRLGFAVSCAHDRVSLVADDRLGAVAMPAELGKQVREVMAEEQDRSEGMPILSYARARREWIFLVGPARGRPPSPGRARRAADLENHGVRILESGQRIWLPMMRGCMRPGIGWPSWSNCGPPPNPTLLVNAHDPHLLDRALGRADPVHTKHAVALLRLRL
ncbi:hypothetical protein [Nocardia xishanensis]|uniref:Uncharacterized protein n=1 Tax=Nocardia xishanensis TaxID=238964 RepID=A0ABW7XCM0_9NOCA